MGSGDVGWVGLAVSMAQQLNASGYTVAGVNVRQYLSAFSDGKSHLTTADVPRDYRVIADRLRGAHLLAAPVILSGVSEGAALSALAAGRAVIVAISGAGAYARSTPYATALSGWASRDPSTSCR